MASLIHAVSKKDNSQHTVFPLPTDLPPLAASSIRVRTTLITLSSNNLTYARNGHALAWWLTWPILSSAPAPYNDADWGVVPAWGYATVLESTVQDVSVDTHLYGFWPTSSHPVDLQLRASEPRGHWVETSPHRHALMSLYNHYVQEPLVPASGEELPLKLAFQCGYLASRFVFPARGEPVHPLGVALPWTERDGDWSEAVVVSLSASSKTGRGFAWNVLRNREKGAGPLALLQATSAPGALRAWEDGEVTVPSKAVGYGELSGTETLKWMESFGPRRVVVLDFGARNGVLQRFVEAMKKGREGNESSPDITVIAVGGEMKVYSDEDMEGMKASMEQLQKVQFNTSGVREKGIELEGPDDYFRNLNAAFARCKKDDGMGHFEIIRTEGVEGIENIWQDLCEQTVKPDQAVVVQV